MKEIAYNVFRPDPEEEAEILHAMRNRGGLHGGCCAGPFPEALIRAEADAMRESRLHEDE